jgi:hypothetical protein
MPGFFTAVEYSGNIACSKDHHNLLYKSIYFARYEEHDSVCEWLRHLASNVAIHGHKFNFSVQIYYY